ncbi:hypothetical protein [Cetobacterium sp. SF1]|uniref:hypothetical protein n=1 Tax=Cetobacterium sp. SF1 TaxID=3417654 RepID=UPI003CF0A65F
MISNYKKIIECYINKVIILFSMIYFFSVFHIKEINIFDKFIIYFICFILIGKIKNIDIYRYIYNEFYIKEYEKKILCFILVLYGSYLFFYPQKYLNRFSGIIFFLGIILLIILISNEIYQLFSESKKLKNRLEILENKTLEYRLKEVIKLEKLINDRDITSILIDDKIGNGKTHLIEYFLKKNIQNYEIISIKLPLIESIEELKITLFKEIKIIFKKNKIRSNYIKEFILSGLNLKIDKIEIGFKKNTEKRNNWDLIQELKSGFEELDQKDRSILLVVDDIERVSDREFLKNALSYIGEFSENFRDSKTTTIFLAQYSIIKNLLISIEGYRIEFLDKYFKYRLKLKTPQINELSKMDLEKILIDSYNNYYDESLAKKISKNQYVNFIRDILEILYTQIGDEEKLKDNIKGDIRTLIKYSKKINPILQEGLYNFPGIMYCIYILFELFTPELVIPNKKIKSFLLELIKKNKDLKGIKYDEKVSQLIHNNYINDSLCDYYEITAFDKLVNNLINNNMDILDQKTIDELNVYKIIELFEELDYKKIYKIFNYSLLNIKNIEELFNTCIYLIFKFENKIFEIEQTQLKNFCFFLREMLKRKCYFDNYKFIFDEKVRKEQEKQIMIEYNNKKLELITSIETKKINLKWQKKIEYEKVINSLQEKIEKNYRNALEKEKKKINEIICRKKEQEQEKQIIQEQEKYKKKIEIYRKNYQENKNKLLNREKNYIYIKKDLNQKKQKINLELSFYTKKSKVYMFEENIQKLKEKILNIDNQLDMIEKLHNKEIQNIKIKLKNIKEKIYISIEEKRTKIENIREEIDFTLNMEIEKLIEEAEKLNSVNKVDAIQKSIKKLSKDNDEEIDLELKLEKKLSELEILYNDKKRNLYFTLKKENRKKIIDKVLSIIFQNQEKIKNIDLLFLKEIIKLKNPKRDLYTLKKENIQSFEKNIDVIIKNNISGECKKL